MKQYDYLLVGSGLYCAVFAFMARKQGKTCLVLEKRDHIGGNIYCEETEGIRVHRYGAHIFHTSDREVWDFVNQFTEFNRYTNSPVANYKGQIYNMPFNMNTFSRMWNISTPEEAREIIERQRSVIQGEPKNLEEQPGGHGYLREAGEGLYGKAVGKRLQRSSGLYYPPPSSALYLRQ